MPFGSRLVLFSSAVFLAANVFASSIVLPRGSELQVVVEHDVSMKVGKEVHARTVYPIYEQNRLVLPAKSEVTGTITALAPAAKSTSRSAKLSGDFTPLHQGEIRFEHITLPDGTRIPLQASTAGDGVAVVRFVSLGAGSKHESLPRKFWGEAVGRERQAVHAFIDPGKSERARRALYSELPYHPELLAAGTQYSVRLVAPVAVPVADPAIAPSPKTGIDGTATLAASLMEDISSRNAVRGTKVHAVVTEPLLDANYQVKVPQGSVLSGEITQAKPADKWGKGGTLRFSFRELKFPAGFTQSVHGAPTSIDTDQNANLQLDAEGGVKPGPKGVAAPLVMGLLAASALHEDEASVMHTAGASNGFALIGRVVALAAKSQYVGAALGFYGTGRAVYSRYIAHGKDVEFPKDTRIEVVLDPDRVNTLRPAN